MYTKAKIFNLALGALGLNKQIIDVDSDTSRENLVLKVHYETALRAALEDMDLEATASQKTLELITQEPNVLWLYAYKYPSNCTFFRRIQSGVVKDTKSTRIKYTIKNHNGTKAIYTNEANAVGEMITDDFNLSLLSSNAGLAIAYKLAWLSSSLIAGKGASAIKATIEKSYALALGNAQEHDQNENQQFDDPEVQSEFVEERIS